MPSEVNKQQEPRAKQDGSASSGVRALEGGSAAHVSTIQTPHRISRYQEVQQNTPRQRLTKAPSLRVCLRVARIPILPSSTGTILAPMWIETTDYGEASAPLIPTWPGSIRGGTPGRAV